MYFFVRCFDSRRGKTLDNFRVDDPPPPLSGSCPRAPAWRVVFAHPSGQVVWPVFLGPSITWTMRSPGIVEFCVFPSVVSVVVDFVFFFFFRVFGVDGGRRGDAR